MRISFCLIALNEEANLARCLESVKELAAEVVILDSGSTDATSQIAQQYSARWHHQDWLGFVGQKNAALALAANDWVFSIDADEELSPELRAEIARLQLTAPPDHCTGFSMPRCVLYEGRWIRHGDWYPDRLVRLFRRSRARFVGGKVHERLELSGDVESLTGELHHYSYRDAADHRARCQRYARLWAETQFAAGRTVLPLAPSFHAVFRWLRGYVLRRGFLDGEQGRRIASFCAWETLLKYRYLQQMRRSTASQLKAPPG